MGSHPCGRPVSSRWPFRSVLGHTSRGSNTDPFLGRGARPIPGLGTRSRAQGLSGADPRPAVGHGGTRWVGGWERPLSREYSGLHMMSLSPGRPGGLSTRCPGPSVATCTSSLGALLGPLGVGVHGGQRPWTGSSGCVSLPWGSPRTLPTAVFLLAQDSVGRNFQGSHMPRLRLPPGRPFGKATAAPGVPQVSATKTQARSRLHGHTVL